MVLKDSLNLPRVVQKGCYSGWEPSLGDGIPHPREPGFFCTVSLSGAWNGLAGLCPCRVTDVCYSSKCLYHSKKMISVHHYCFQREIRPECSIKSTSIKFIWLLLNIFDLIFKVNECILQFFFLSNSFLISGDFRFFFFSKTGEMFFQVLSLLYLVLQENLLCTENF